MSTINQYLLELKQNSQDAGKSYDVLLVDIQCLSFKTNFEILSSL